MIVAHGKFVLATPSRCGTHSFQALARSTPGMEWIPTMHSMEVPEQYDDLDRILIVRDPYDRLVSIWDLLRRWTAMWGHREMKDMTFDEFVHWFHAKRHLHMRDPKATSKRAPWLWLWNCTENANVFMPSQVLYLEEADLALKYLIANYGIQPKKRDIEVMYRGNTSDNSRGGKRGWDLERFYSKKRTLATVNDMWAAMDCESFGYGAIER